MEVNEEKIREVGYELIKTACESGLDPIEQAIMFEALADSSKKAALLVVLMDVLGEDADDFIEMKVKREFERVIDEAEEAINGNQ